MSERLKRSNSSNECVSFCLKAAEKQAVCLLVWPITCPKSTKQFNSLCYIRNNKSKSPCFRSWSKRVENHCNDYSIWHNSHSKCPVNWVIGCSAHNFSSDSHKAVLRFSNIRNLRPLVLRLIRTQCFKLWPWCLTRSCVDLRWNKGNLLLSAVAAMTHFKCH